MNYTSATSQVLRGDYDEKCDCWSIGVLAFMLLSGTPPFDGSTTADILKATETGMFQFRGRAWQNVSNQVTDSSHGPLWFLTAMLNPRRKY